MLLVTAVLMAASTSAATVHRPLNDSANRNCPRSSAYYAWQRDRPLVPRKLNELPPATTYMAVLREIGGCDAPLTLIEYRRAGRR